MTALRRRVGGVAVGIGRDIWRGHLYVWRAIGEFIVAHPILCVAAVILVQVIILNHKPA